MNIVAAKKAKRTKTAKAVKNVKAVKSPKRARKAASAAVFAAPAIAVPVPDNKTIYQAFIAEILNAGRFETASQYLDVVATSHNPFPDQQPGREGFESALRAFREAFPDMQVKASHLVAEGELVVGRFEITGTHRGPFMGIPATGNAIQYEEMAIVRFAGGKIVEHWSVADGIAILQQLQAAP
jgi:predicted ester cyclase